MSLSIDPNKKRGNVAGEPDKRFFVSMLTRDIELEDAILDLIDNSIDGALRVRNEELSSSDRFDGYYAHILIGEDTFSISDNCGGIPWEIAEKVAFRNGAPENEDRPDGSIGTVGIGMKRAIFKMGKSAIALSQSGSDSFYVEIPPNWITSRTWKFPAYNAPNDSECTGTEIEISNLHDSVAKQFLRESYIDDIVERISDTYPILISKGFSIKVNGTPVIGREIKICYEEHSDTTPIQPYMWEWQQDDTRVFIAVGYRGRLYEESPTNPRYPTRTAGISVMCNNRVVLPHDKSHKTGWGVGNVATFHNQFSSIVGVVDMWSSKIDNLPITTTKNGVDLDSKLYRKILNRLMEALKVFTANTSAWKGSESTIKTRLDEAEKLGISEIRSKSELIAWTQVRGDSAAKYFKPILPKKRKIKDHIKISYSKTPSEIAKVGEFLYDDPTASAKEVGVGSFDYVYNQIANK